MQRRRVCRLFVCLSNPRQISKTKRDRREILSPSQEIRDTKQEYNVTFCSGEKTKNEKISWHGTPILWMTSSFYHATLL